MYYDTILSSDYHQPYSQHYRRKTAKCRGNGIVFSPINGWIGLFSWEREINDQLPNIVHSAVIILGKHSNANEKDIQYISIRQAEVFMQV